MTTLPPSLPQAKRAEVLSISAEFEDGPGSDSGRRLEHRHGLCGEAEGGAALVCVREAFLHQRTGARRTPELLTPGPTPVGHGRATGGPRVRVPPQWATGPVLFPYHMNACTCEDTERVFDAEPAFEDLSQASYCYFCNEPLQTIQGSFVVLCIELAFQVQILQH